MHVVSEVDAADAPEDAGAIAVVVLTHNRVHLLRKCVEHVLLRTSDATAEIVIWDNASTDGTRDYLATIDDPRFQIVHSEDNVGQNGYARAFRRTRSPFMIELDDDVVDAPHGWDRTLRDAFVRLPSVGFLAADLEDDPHDEASQVRHHVRPHEYTLVVENGIRLLRGPTGGGCAITSRELNERVGGFREQKNQVFWLEDEAYIRDIGTLGLEAAVLADLRVHHTGGPYYSATTPEKEEFWRKWKAARARRDAIKGVLFALPFFGRLNARYGWFRDPRQPAGV
jgi:GT2 family glycosyltransferase